MLAAGNAGLSIEVASGKAREAAKDRRIAELEADHARLSIEATTLRKRRCPNRRRCSSSWSGRSAFASETCRTACSTWPASTSPRARATCRQTRGSRDVRVTVPLDTLSIAWDAFRDCAGLAQVTLPVTVTVIGRCAFYDCTSLTEMTLPPDLTEIKGYAFSECASLSKIVLPPNLTEIGQCAFIGCTSLAEITLPLNLTAIGLCAFHGCTSLAEITLPPGAVDIGWHAFYGCPGTPRRIND